MESDARTVASESGIFASITPANSMTSHAMQRIVDWVFRPGSSLTHHQQFIVPRAGDMAATESPRASLELDESLSYFPTGLEGSEDDEVSNETEHTYDIGPCYILSIGRAIQPRRRGHGFWFGSGNFIDDPENGAVDLLLPSSATEPEVCPRHGRIAFDAEYGRLWIHAANKKGIYVDGHPISPRSKRMLMKRSRIAIGPYQFIFEFKVTNEDEFQKVKNAYFQSFLHQVYPFESTSATPSSADVRVGDWLLHGVVGEARDASVIQAASNVRSGVVVEVRRLRVETEIRSSEEEDDLYADITESISTHRYKKFVMQKYGKLENVENCPLREAYLLLTPLARGTFDEFGYGKRWYDAPLNMKKYLFVQTLLGLSALHEHGWMHRDIKPQNLGVVSFGRRPLAIIMDHGQAVEHEDGHRPYQISKNRYGLGSPGYKAPELEGHGRDFYSKEVDIFSMGVVGYFLFIGGHVPWATTPNMFRKMDDPQNSILNLFREERERLLQNPVESLEVLLGNMLLESPEDRPTIAEVLYHPALRDIRDAIDRRLVEELRV